MQTELLKLEFQLVFWANRSNILLALNHFLLILVIEFVVDDLPGFLPIGQGNFKSYLNCPARQYTCLRPVTTTCLP